MPDNLSTISADGSEKYESASKDIAINDTFYHTPFNYFVVRTVDPVPKDAGLKLYTSFQGSMLSGLNGLYKSSYFDTVAKETRHLATTHFEPVAARKAFPCLDEPNLKAEFSIRVIHRDSYTALSNMPTETTHSPVWEESEDLVVTTFQRSVKMSTYLVCVIVCDFGHIQIKSSSGKLIRVYAPDDRLSQAHYALQVAKHTVDDFEGRLKIDYVLPKVDLVAIPDFSSGAMENWGLITFRETALLCDPDSVSANAQQRVAEVVVQELAHQWFGNLVTMNWWNDVWLNKGFASYMQYVGTSTKQPAWDMILCHRLF
ncbi:endoplasmic reticulum aminopeptidase 2-like [Aplysia californica]|uniref:glutamyl aminopeptidase n=1 Tax=Aplysia californica TaxID=6500 RepID=A0ABM1W1Y1_APLCA|nr:endoplasmic reticulum aminopeptidase 2-like [Aplysia californica]